MVNLLDVRGLSIAVPGQLPLVEDLTFSLSEGERVALIGASGCGKSLTAAALSGLLRPPVGVIGGEIHLDGVGFARARPARWRQVRGPGVFQIFQSPGLVLSPARRVGRQLDEAARLVSRSPASSVAEALDLVALPARVRDLFPYQLSGGMKQRVLIAMALILRPRLLIADEPTTGLDVLTEREVLATLGRTTAATGAALLFISHDLRAVRQLCDRVLVMENGRLVADTTPAGLEDAAPKAARRLAEAARKLEISPSC